MELRMDFLLSEPTAGPAEHANPPTPTEPDQPVALAERIPDHAECAPEHTSALRRRASLR